MVRSYGIVRRRMVGGGRRDRGRRMVGRRGMVVFLKTLVK